MKKKIIVSEYELRYIIKKMVKENLDQHDDEDENRSPAPEDNMVLLKTGERFYGGFADFETGEIVTTIRYYDLSDMEFHIDFITPLGTQKGFDNGDLVYFYVEDNGEIYGMSEPLGFDGVLPKRLSNQIKSQVSLVNKS